MVTRSHARLKKQKDNLLGDESSLSAMQETTTHFEVEHVRNHIGMPEPAPSKHTSSSEEDCEAINTPGHDSCLTPTMEAPCPDDFQSISTDDWGGQTGGPRLRHILKPTNSNKISKRLENLKSLAQNFA